MGCCVEVMSHLEAFHGEIYALLGTSAGCRSNVQSLEKILSRLPGPESCCPCTSCTETQPLFIHWCPFDC